MDLEFRIFACLVPFLSVFCEKYRSLLYIPQMSSPYEDTWKRDPRSFVGAAHADPTMQLSCLLTVNRNLGTAKEV